MSCKRALFISNLYPNPLEPHRAAFSRQQIAAMNELIPVDVIAPIAWTTRGRQIIPKYRTSDGIEIYHPTYWYPPGVGRVWYGEFFLASIRGIAERLLRSREYDVVYSTWLYPDGWACAQLAAKFGKPFVQNVVGTDVNRLRPASALTGKSLLVADQAACVVSVSRGLKEHLVALGAEADKIHVVYNGVDRTIFRPLDKETLLREMGLAGNRKRILFVGNLKQEKGLAELAKSFAVIAGRNNQTNFELVIIGTGPYEKQIRNLLGSAGVAAQATFLGSRPQAEIAQWMNACDLFCLPSYSEGQPNVLIEALACQAPVVATNVGGIPELDQGLGNMVLVEPRMVMELADAIESVLFKDVSNCCNDFICSWQENAASILRLFEECC